MSHLYKYSLLLPLLLGAYFLINPAIAQPSGRDAKATPTVSSSPTRSNDTDKANLNYLTDGDPTPLMRAAQKGDLAQAKLLVENGADVNEAVAGDGSPLIVAAKEGHLQLVTYLVQKGADVNGAVLGDGNPLIAAAANGHASVMAFLVEKGAGVNAIVPGDETALIQAAGRGHLEIVKYLVARGADVHLAVLANEGIDAELRSPLNQALKHGHRAVATFLREKGARE
jgi:ankyrin repeat protein